jgi:predicted RNA methylase
MMRYETPDEVARRLAQYAPRRVCTILDPAVGRGALLKPLVRRFGKTLKKLICVDSDGRLAEILRENLGPTVAPSLHFVHADFLTWSTGRKSELSEVFDCVVMNPPFAGRKAGLVAVDLAKEFPKAKEGVHFAPLEGAFVARALRLLRPGGRLLAVLPSTLIASQGTIWLRELLLEMGSPLLVHELPRGTFKGVDASVFLLVYQKSKRRDKLALCNSDLAKPDRIVLRRSALPPHLRLDYRFHKANLWYKTVRAAYPALGWATLGELAQVYRGAVESPIGGAHVLHTVDRRNAFWQMDTTKAGPPELCDSAAAQPGDLVVARVGRRCAQSTGLYVGAKPVPCSDCLLIIRPKGAGSATHVLLAMRVLLGWDCGAALVECGTGASYIPQQQLASLAVPFNLQAKCPQLFKNYETALRRRDSRLMESVESRIRGNLLTPKGSRWKIRSLLK